MDEYFCFNSYNFILMYIRHTVTSTESLRSHNYICLDEAK